MFAIFDKEENRFLSYDLVRQSTSVDFKGVNGIAVLDQQGAEQLAEDFNSAAESDRYEARAYNL